MIGECVWAFLADQACIELDLLDPDKTDIVDPAGLGQAGVGLVATPPVTIMFG